MKDTSHEKCATENTDGLGRCVRHRHDTQTDQNNGNVFRIVPVSSDRFFKHDLIRRIPLEAVPHHIECQ